MALPEDKRMNNTLGSLLKEHELWLRTHGKEGKQLVIEEQNLSGLDLSGINLTNCAFSMLNLTMLT
jgi:uncharacterized protein YjbI with pentapeptide repeats